MKNADLLSRYQRFTTFNPSRHDIQSVGSFVEKQKKYGKNLLSQLYIDAFILMGDFLAIIF